MKYKGEKITSDNVKSFFEGNILFYSDKLFSVLPAYKKEQVIYRAYVCKDTCLIEKKCKACGCDVPERFYVDKKYEKRKCTFQDFMSKKEWSEFKITKKINIDELNIEVSKIIKL